MAQSADAVEYTDYFSEEGSADPHPNNEYFGYDPKPSDNMAHVINELRGMLSIPLLPSLPVSLWSLSGTTC